MKMNKVENKIISFLPPEIMGEWNSHMEWVQLQLGQILYEPRRPLNYLYFPSTAIVSSLNILTDGNPTEVAMTGREGLIGMCLLIGDTQSIHQTWVQKSGSAIRIRSNVILDSFRQNSAVQKLLLYSLRNFITHISQVSVCHKHHTLEQQLSRLFLLRLDRQDDNKIELTHELLSNLLGVRREGVSDAAHRLMKKNILSYSRGNITVLDPKALAAHACECHGVISQSYRQFFSHYESRASALPS
jgi:CRP-like cAMP-binding protein